MNTRPLIPKSKVFHILQLHSPFPLFRFRGSSLRGTSRFQATFNHERPHARTFCPSSVTRAAISVRALCSSSAMHHIAVFARIPPNDPLHTRLLAFPSNTQNFPANIGRFAIRFASIGGSPPPPLGALSRIKAVGADSR